MINMHGVIYCYPAVCSDWIDVCWSKLLEDEVEDVVETECKGVDRGVVGGMELFGVDGEDCQTGYSSTSSDF